MKTSFKLLGRALILEHPRRIHTNNRNVQTRSDPSPSLRWRNGVDNFDKSLEINQALVKTINSLEKQIKVNADLQEQVCKLQENMKLTTKNPEKPTEKKSWSYKRVEGAANKSAENYIRLVVKLILGGTGLVMIGAFTTQDQQTSVKQFIDNFVKNKPALKWAKEKIFWKSAEELEAEKILLNRIEAILIEIKLIRQNQNDKDIKLDALEKKIVKNEINYQERIKNLENEANFMGRIWKLVVSNPNSVVANPTTRINEPSNSK